MDDLPIYEEIIRLKKCRIPGALATVVETRGSSPRKAGAKMLIRQDGTIAGTIGGGPTEVETIGAALEVIRQGKPRTLSFALTERHGGVCGGEVVIYLEPLVVPLQLLVVGSGHVGRAVRQAAEQAGFLVTMLNTMPAASLPPQAEAARYCPVQELPAVLTEIGVDGGSYLFIATSDHQQDFLAAAAALKTAACYIGLLGSRKKRVALDKYLADQGFTKADNLRLISPAGLEIGAETPAEIAISVVAQMIQVRRLGHAEHLRSVAGGRAVQADGMQQAFAAAGS